MDFEIHSKIILKIYQILQASGRNAVHRITVFNFNNSKDFSIKCKSVIQMHLHKMKDHRVKNKISQYSV